ncbi:Hypothetical protein HVR_LOCUS399 [uncultured virus]|nr:Hypothetical protein HVR_LOCUS399 [uncultured virus]
MTSKLLNPPNISGTWKSSIYTYLRQEYPDQTITLKDIEYQEIPLAKIKQKGLFITYDQGSSGLSESKPRAGIWRPIFLNGKINWELLLSDNIDNHINFMQVMKSDECGNPTKLYSVVVESGFMKGNPEQTPEVAYRTLKKIRD